MYELLQTCKEEGIRVGIMTGKSRVSANISLRELSIEKYIDVLVAGDDVEMPKPHPEGVIAAISQLGHNAEEKGAMVGDSAADTYRRARCRTLHDRRHLGRPRARRPPRRKTGCHL